MDAEPFRFVHHGRSRTALVAVGATWALCALVAVVFDAAIWIVGAVLICTIPALRDYWLGISAGVELSSDRLVWFSGRRSAEVALREIDHVRLVTRFDLSVRATVVLTSGRKLRMPVEATPPHREFEDALTARGVRTERHHFTGL